MSDSDPPTAASILSALLLTPTAFLQTPTLASLRATLNSHNPNLSAQTNDHNLRLALKHVIRHRRKVVDQVEERIGSYRLLPKEVKGKGKGKGRGRGGGGKVEEDDGFNADPSALPLADVLALLAAEEERLTTSLADAQAELADTKAQLERAARRIEGLDLPDVGATPPSVRREVDARLGGLEAGVKTLQRRVDGINARAEGGGLGGW